MKQFDMFFVSLFVFFFGYFLSPFFSLFLSVLFCFGFWDGKFTYYLYLSLWVCCECVFLLHARCTPWMKELEHQIQAQDIGMVVMVMVMLMMMLWKSHANINTHTHIHNTHIHSAHIVDNFHVYRTYILMCKSSISMPHTFSFLSNYFVSAVSILLSIERATEWE